MITERNKASDKACISSLVHCQLTCHVFKLQRILRWGQCSLFHVGSRRNLKGKLGGGRGRGVSGPHGETDGGKSGKIRTLDSKNNMHNTKLILAMGNTTLLSNYKMTSVPALIDKGIGSFRPSSIIKINTM